MSGRGAPLSQFIIKVHSRCDLACDHCYVYTKADQSWNSRPRAMSEEIVARTAGRIAEHARFHRLDDVRIVLHGGEPLLAGRPLLGRLLSILRDALSFVPEVDIRIHTNGLLLDEGFCDLFAEHGVRVGVSLDGDRRANDLHRRYADGRGSYDQVSRALRLLQSRPGIYGGILCTIDLANDPANVYRALLRFEPPHVDFLLPHATWDDPPPRPAGRPAPYADWLLSVFRLWEEGGRPVDVRLFNSIIRTTHGRSSLTEAIGLEPSALVVIETDGTYEQVDSLKVAYEGAAGTGMNVFSHDLDAVAAHPGVVARRTGLAGLSRICRECPVVSSCGGGLYPHRYRSGAGFDEPSVFCPDLYKLITNVRGEIKIQRHVLPSSHARRSGPRTGRRAGHTLAGGVAAQPSASPDDHAAHPGGRPRRLGRSCGHGVPRARRDAPRAHPPLRPCLGRTVREGDESGPLPGQHRRGRRRPRRSRGRAAGAGARRPRPPADRSHLGTGAG
ncbi:FxsB family cyclophane-forming radical SAM/SPASM peptide maturase [Nonomuraea ferruginea]